VPSATPTLVPTAAPSHSPTAAPTAAPTVLPPTVLSALLALNRSGVAVSGYASLVLASSAALVELSALTPKTVLAPLDAALNGTSLSEAELLGHIFDGDLNSSVLANVTEIVAVSGERYAVTVTQTARARERRAVVFTVSNNRSSARLVTLDSPSARGTVHAIDGVLRPAVANSTDDGDTSSSSSSDDGTLLWAIVGFTVVFVCLLGLIFVCLTRHIPKDGDPATWVNEGGPETGTGGVDDEKSRYIASMDSALRGMGRPTHYYPPTEPTGGGGAVVHARRTTVKLDYPTHGHNPLYGQPPREGYIDIKHAP